MEQRSDSQALVSPVVATSPAPISSPSGGLIFRRTLRLLLRRFVYVLVVVFRPLRRFALFALVVATLLGVIGWLGFQLWVPRTGSIPDTRAAPVAPAAAVENYIKGQQNANAELMWDSLSPDLQASQLGSGSSKATIQSQVDRKRADGLQFNRYVYVGGQAGDDQTLYTYYVDVQLNQQRGTIPITFVVDTNGKIVNIISPPLLNDMAQPSSQ